MKKKEDIVSESAEELQTDKLFEVKLSCEDVKQEEGTSVDLREDEAPKVFSFDTLRTAMILLIVTGFTVLMLAVVNYFTQGPIQELRKKELDTTVNSMFPDAEYTEITGVNFTDSVSTLYMIHTKADEPIGFLAIACPQGFGGEIELIVGTDLEQNVVGVKILSDSETVTKVAALKADGFLNSQYQNKKAPFSFSKDGGSVEAVSGSTISSKAVLDGVNSVCKTVENYINSLKGGAK